MRGMALQLPAAFSRRVHQMLGPPLSEREIGQEEQVGNDILDHLDSLGSHWTDRRGIAEIASGQRRGGSHLPIIIHGAVDPAETSNQGFRDENETTLPANHPVRVTRMEVHDGQQWRDVFSTPRAARA